jgi:hypothetical protein
MASDCIFKFTPSRPVNWLDYGLPSASRNSLNHGIKVCMIMTSRFILKPAQSWPRSSSVRSLNLITISKLAQSWPHKCITRLAQSWPPSSHDHGLQLYLTTHTIMACVFALTWPPSASLNLLNHSLQVCTIMACKCIRKLTPSRPPSSSWSSLDRYPQAHPDFLSSTTCSQFRYTVCRWIAI